MTTVPPADAPASGADASGPSTAVLPQIFEQAAQSAAPAAGAVRRGPRRLLVGAALTALVVAGTGGASLAGWFGKDAEAPVRAAAAAVIPAKVVPTPVAALTGTRPDGTVPWQGPLGVSVTDGTLSAVTAVAADGSSLAGAVGADGTWTATGGLLPASTYSLVAQVRDADGKLRSLPLSTTTTAAEKTEKVSLAPGDGAVVGVGQAISVRLATPVKDKAARAEVEKRLAVTTTPAVVGSWRWMSSSEVRYRGETLWAAGTKVTVTAALQGLQVVPGVWGEPTRSASFTIGDALTSVVDTKAHTMTVSKNGQVLKVMKASMGKPQFETRSGTFVVLEKFADRVMDSATVDLPPGTPAYKTAVKDAVRITNSGTFTHGAPWSVPSQGVANVSHGCINLSPADAHWYFLQAKRGDVVTVVNSAVPAVLSDAGSQDWNLTFAQWKSGSALA